AHLLPLMRLPNLGYSRHMKEVKRLMFPQPSTGLQEQFEIAVYKVNKQKALFAQGLAESDALFSSIQNQAFQGRL
ncbi:MAG: hypothetical protein RQ729_13430, partial [Wenzhouxiangellaceae bacterium]|nr:hypothetical protein [Wenzhouxiangellaceae bacterium]